MQTTDRITTMNRVESVVQTLPSSQRRTSSGIRRTQTVTWNEQLTQGWRFIDSSETLEKRVLRYISYLNPSESQLSHMCTNIQKHIETGADEENDLLHQVAHIEFDENGVAYAADLGCRSIVAVRIEKRGDDVTVEEASTPLIDATCDLTSPETTAFELFEAVANTVKKLKAPKQVGPNGYVPIAFVCSFDVILRSKKSMYLNKWSKGMQTGRSTDDPVEGSDMAAMLDTALRRAALPYRVTSVMNDLVTAAILGLTQLNNDSDNSVRFMMNLGTGFNIGSIVGGHRMGVNGRGDCVDMKVNQYDSSIPRADFDLEVDWADGNINENPVEKLVAGKYLGEIARRVLLKVFNASAPKLAWSRGSLPTEAAMRIATDTSEGLAVSREILQILWDWTITHEEADYAQRICVSVFNRSASMVAASLCAVVRAKNGLIPALGGSIVAVSGRLYNTFYRHLVRAKIDSILGPILSRLLILEPVKGGSAVGAALVLLQKQ